MKEDAAKELSQQLSAFIREMEATLIEQIQAEVKLAHATALRHVENSVANELKKKRTIYKSIIIKPDESRAREIGKLVANTIEKTKAA